MKTRLYPLLILVTFLLFNACQKEEAANNRLPYQADGLFSAEEEAILSKHLDTEKFNYLRNISTSEQYKIFLGRVLFYDHHLSKDESVSCASCHQQQYGFADNVALSKGASGNLTDRNSIALASFGSFSDHYGEDTGPVLSLIENSFFWDERVGELTEQMMQTFANPKEMGMDLPEIGKRVSELEYATILYNRAFDGQPVTTQNVIEAISSFVNRINSTDAPFDIGLVQSRNQLEEEFPNFDEFKNQGKQLFLDNCASCHAFSLSNSFRNKFQNTATAASNGLDLEYADQGMGSHTFLPEDNGVFKIPGLRNVEITAPYMHDGRFATLEEVVEFYSSGIQAHPNLSEVLKDEDGAPITMNFSEEEKKNLVSFLKTLTGVMPTFEGDLSNPFK